MSHGHFYVISPVIHEFDSFEKVDFNINLHGDYKSYEHFDFFLNLEIFEILKFCENFQFLFLILEFGNLLKFLKFLKISEFPLIDDG